MVNKYVKDSNDQMDFEITNGMFGDLSNKILNLYKEGNMEEFYYESIKSMVDIYKNDKQILITYLNEFINIFSDAINADSTKCKQIVDSTFLGTPEHPDLELSSSYKEYIEEENELKDVYNRYIEMKDIKSEMALARKSLNVYSTSCEFTLKLSTYVIALKKVANGENFNIEKIHNFVGQRKVEQFISSLKDKNNILKDTWNIKIRNAIAHNDISYNFQDELFHGKYKYKVSGKKKVEEFTISLTELDKELFKTRLFFHCYQITAELFVLRHTNDEFFNKSMEYINY